MSSTTATRPGFQVQITTAMGDPATTPEVAAGIWVACFALDAQIADFGAIDPELGLWLAPLPNDEAAVVLDGGDIEADSPLGLIVVSAA